LHGIDIYAPEMPPKSKIPGVSRDIISVGGRQVFKSAASKRLEEKERPTTTKALVLRNGKHGAMGTGELVLQSRMGGREKLDLLSGEYQPYLINAVLCLIRGLHKNVLWNSRS
jgi:hypothetical protein